MSEQIVRIFVSSPGDAMDERRRVEAVAERLNGEFEPRVKVELVRWETSYYSAHETFQKQIPEAADCDLVVAVFRARLGTELPQEFRKLPNGDPYPSGTAYEVLSAIEARQSGKPLPDVYVFRCSKSPTITIDDPNGPAIRAEWERLKQFFDTWFKRPDGSFLAAFQSFDTTDQFAAQIEDCVRQWLVRRGFVEEGKIWDRTVKGSPFPGLEPYDPQREVVFFGRYLDTVHAIERLRDAGNNGLPFLLLIGASDAGKSSLMRAGVLPQLVRPGTIPGVELWRKALVVPGVDPLMSLASALFTDDALGGELHNGDFATPEMLANLFAAADADASIAPIHTALGRAATARATELNSDEIRPARLALGIDQAERLFLETNAGVADIFAKLLAALVTNKLAYVVVALRSDAYSRFQLVDAFRALRAKGVIFDVVQPGRAELEDIVIRPIAACRPPLDFEVKDGRSLADTLIADAAGADELPLLQMAMSRLFKGEAVRGDGVLRFADYSGLGEAVSETAQDALMTLDTEAQSQLSALILALVSDIAFEPGTETLVPAVNGFDRPEFESNKPARTKLVDAFIANHLLVAEEHGKMLRVRPAHEALLRIWPEAVKIINANATAIRVRHLLQRIVRDWAAAPASGKRDYAALPPALLGGARQVMDLCGDDLSADMRAFISQALELDAARREDEIQERNVHDRAQAAEALAASEMRLFRRTVAGLVLVAGLAVVGLWQWREAQSQRKLAETRLDAAVATANSLVSDFAYKFRHTVGVPIGLVEDILERVNKFQEELGETTPQLLESKAAAQGQLASTLLALGATSRALDRAREASDIYANLTHSVPGNDGFQLGLSWSSKKVGDVLLARGDLSDAYDAYRKSFEIATKLHGKDATNADWQHDLSETDNKLGDVLVAQGKIDDARAMYQNGLDVAKVPIRGDGDQLRWESDLAWSYSKIGDIDVLEKKIEAALADYRNSLERRKSLATKDENNTEWQHDLWISENKFGDALAAEGAFKKAYDVYMDGLAIARTLADKDSANSEWQHQLALSYGKIGDALLAQSKSAEALKAYRERLSISEALVAHDAEDTDWMLDLIDVNWKLAKMNDGAATRLDFVISQLKQLQSQSKIAPDKADWLPRAEADRAAVASQ